MLATYSESTSIAKVSALLPALKAWSREDDPSTTTQPATTFLAANVRELSILATAARSDTWELFSADNTRWWYTLDAMQLESPFRSSLGLLAGRPANDVSGWPKGGLEFLTTEGVVQNAISFLPFARNQFIQLGDKGE